MRKSTKCGHEDQAVKEAWEGRGPAEYRFDLARANKNILGPTT